MRVSPRAKKDVHSWEDPSHPNILSSSATIMSTWNTVLSWDGGLSREDAKVVKRWWKCSYESMFRLGYDLGPRFSPSPIPSHLPRGCRNFREIVELGVVIVSRFEGGHPLLSKRSYLCLCLGRCRVCCCQSATAVYRPDKSRWRLTLLTPSSDPLEDYGQDTRYITVDNRGSHILMATLIPLPRGRRFLQASLPFLR